MDETQFWKFEDNAFWCSSLCDFEDNAAYKTLLMSMITECLNVSLKKVGKLVYLSSTLINFN